MAVISALTDPRSLLSILVVCVCEIQKRPVNQRPAFSIAHCRAHDRFGPCGNVLAVRLGRIKEIILGHRCRGWDVDLFSLDGSPRVGVFPGDANFGGGKRVGPAHCANENFAGAGKVLLP